MIFFNQTNQPFRRLDVKSLNFKVIILWDNSFNLLLFLAVISIIFVDDKLFRYQMIKFTDGRVFDSVESGNVAEASV